MKGKHSTYNLKDAIHKSVKFYNNKHHTTIKCTPEEAFHQKYISTFELEGLDEEEVRCRTVASSKMKGILMY